MRWDLFAVLMLLPWAATFGGSLMAARARQSARALYWGLRRGL